MRARARVCVCVCESMVLPTGEPVHIGTGKRPEIAKQTWVPGPGSYAPKMAGNVCLSITHTRTTINPPLTRPFYNAVHKTE